MIPELICVIKSNKNWLPWKRPLRDQKTSFRLIVYFYGHRSINPENLAKIGPDVEILLVGQKSLKIRNISVYIYIYIYIHKYIALGTENRLAAATLTVVWRPRRSSRKIGLSWQMQFPWSLLPQWAASNNTLIYFYAFAAIKEDIKHQRQPAAAKSWNWWRKLADRKQAKPAFRSLRNPWVNAKKTLFGVRYKMRCSRH